MGGLEDAPGIETAAVVIAGWDGLIAFASPAVRELLRYEPDWLVGCPIELLVLEAFAKRHRAGWNRTWGRGELPPPKSPVMIPVACGDGEVRRFASHLLPLVARHGQLLAVAAVWAPPSEADAGVRDLT